MEIRFKLALLAVGLVLIGLALWFSRGSAPAGGLRAAFAAEFLVRPDGYPGLSREYGFEFREPPVQMDPGLMYRAVADGAAEVICGFATDGRIPAYNLKVLADDRHFFPPYYAAPLVRRETLERYPGLAETLNLLKGRLSNETMQRMNYAVDEGGSPAADVARDFLAAEGLLPGPEKAAPAPEGEVVIGGKQFTEQEILGEILAVLIESRLGLKVVRKLNLGGTIICFNALRAGDLDLYPEYTGTGLVNILDLPAERDPEAVYRKVKRAFAEKYGLDWLEPFGFNNTYTLTMRRDQARKLGIETISDLARYENAGRKLKTPNPQAATGGR